MVYLTPSKLISLLRMVYFKKKPEAEISSAFIKFQRELLCRGPQEAKTFIAKNMVITRFQGVLTNEEMHLVKHDTVGIW
jgi:uncharacterized protein YbcI